MTADKRARMSDEEIRAVVAQARATIARCAQLLELPEEQVYVSLPEGQMVRAIEQLLAERDEARTKLREFAHFAKLLTSRLAHDFPGGYHSIELERRRMVEGCIKDARKLLGEG